MNNQLTEVKRNKFLEEESFMYTFSSDDNKIVSNMEYEIDFGGFELTYDNYKAEVINCGHNGRVSTTNIFLYLVCENLADNGNFFRTQLKNRTIVLATLPVQVAGDQYMRFTGSTGITFNVKNCRILKRIKLRFLKPDFTTLTNGADINVGAATKWFVMLKMTPIVD